MDAYSICTKIGGELLEIHNEKELKELEVFLQKKPLENIFIGAYVDFSTHRWYWKGSNKTVQFTNWAKPFTNPDAVHAGGTVARVDRNTGKWSSIKDPFKTKSGYICSLPSCPKPFDRLGDLCYHFEMEHNATLMYVFLIVLCDS